MPGAWEQVSWRRDWSLVCLLPILETDITSIQQQYPCSECLWVSKHLDFNNLERNNAIVLCNAIVCIWLCCVPIKDAVQRILNPQQQIFCEPQRCDESWGSRIFQCFSRVCLRCSCAELLWLAWFIHTSRRFVPWYFLELVFHRWALNAVQLNRGTQTSVVAY